MAGFLFGGNTGLSYQDLQSKREAADALAKRIMGMQPKNVPEGIGALLMGAASGIGRYRADKGLSEGRAAASTQFDSILGRILGNDATGATDATGPTVTGSRMSSPGVANELASTRPGPAAVPAFADDGTELGGYLSDQARRSSLPAGMRNNNPGNIKFVGQKVPGIVGPSVNTDQGDPQAVFETPEAGMSAMFSLAKRKYDGGKKSTNQLIAGNMGWTPGNYDAAANVARTMGIQPDDDINMNDPDMAARFMQALILQEHGQKGRLYPQEMIRSVVGGGRPVQVASTDPSAGMPTADSAINAIAPPSGAVMPPAAPQASAYVDPRVSAPNYQQPANQMTPPQSQLQNPSQGASMPNQNPAQPGGMPLPQQEASALSPLPSRDVSAAPPVASAPPQQIAQAAPAQIPRMQPYRPNPEMLKLLSNPFLDEGQKGALRMVMQQDMQQHQAQQEQQIWQARQDYETQQHRSDPRYQQELQLGQVQIDQAKGPKYTYTTLPDGTVLRTDPRGGAPEKVFESAPKPTANMQDYEAYASEERAAGRAPLGRMQYEQEIKKAGASNTTNIVGGEGDKFFENLDKKNAETFAAMSDAGIQARGRLGQIDRLEGIFQNVPQGAEGAFKKLAGDWGVPIGEGTSDIQAASALLEKMVPEQRLPGSGTMSDGDIKMFRASLPRIINQPGGNQLIFQTMRGIADYERQMGEIADSVADRAITPAEGRLRIRQLKNPLAEYKIPEGSTPNGGFKTRTGVQWSVE